MRGHGETVLIVDDEIGLLVSAASMLKKLGYKVLTAATPDEAFQQVKSDSHVDLLLTDMAMPVVSGLDLADRLR